MRPEKKLMVQEIEDRLKKANPIIVTRYQGVNAESMNQLRALSKKQGSVYMVVKNRLLKIAAKQAQINDLGVDFKDRTAILFGGGDPVALSKIFTHFAKENKGFTIEGGLLDSQFLTQEQIKALASLPSRDVLIAKLVGQINAPISRFVGGLGGLLRNLVGVLSQIRDQKTN